MNQPTKLLLDADILIFQACVVVEKVAQWDDDVWTIMYDPRDAIIILEDTITTFEDDTGIATQDMVFALSDAKNFRYDVTSTYKSNRVGKRKPLCYPSVKAYLINKYVTKVLPNVEGDDVLGLLQTDDTAIWSRDKDLKQIPGLHWVDDDWEEVTEAEADRFFLFQCLVGDTSDGYSGCPGVGPVRANAILDNDCSWEAVVAAYEKKGLFEADAYINAHQARILRPGEYNFTTMEPILWEA